MRPNDRCDVDGPPSASHGLRRGMALGARTRSGGTIVQRSAPQLTCVATGADYTIKGTFAR